MALATGALQGGLLGPRSPGCGAIFCDAVGYYLPTFRSVLDSGLPTDGFLYPPFFALVGAPLGMLGAGFAWGWALFQLAGFLLLALAGARLLEGRWALGYLALLALSEPVLDNMVWGNVSVLLTGMVFGALALEHAGRPRSGAALLGAAIAIKYYPALFLIWWLVRREWRFVGWAVGCALVFSALPVFVLGPDGFVAFMQSTGDRLGALADRNVLLSQAPIAVLGRLAAYTGLTWPFALALWFPALVLLLVFAGKALMRAARDGDAPVVMSLLWLALPLLAASPWPHYLAYLPFVQTVALRETRKVEGGIGAVLTGVVAVSIAATTWIALLVVGVAIHPALGLPFFAGVLALAALVAALTLPSRAAAPPLP
jgi:alpha-1,2-mannosyltransferase